MRKPYLLLPALLLAASHVLAQGKAVIVGSISGPLSDQVELVYYPNPLLPEETKIQVQLQGKTFRVEVPLERPLVAELQHSEEVAQLYLEPGYELELSTSGKNFLKSLKYKGNGASENNYLAGYTLRFEEEEEYQALPDNVKLTEQAFAEFLDYRRSDQLSNFEKYTSKHQVSDTFRTFLLAEINFSYALDKLRYHPLRQQMMQVALARPSAAFYEDLYSLNLSSPENLISPSFLSFLHTYTANLAQEQGCAKTSPLYFKARYEAAGQELQGQVKLAAQAQVLKQSVQQGGHLQYSEQMLQEFKAHSTDAAANTYFDRLLDGHSSLVAGAVAPDLELVNLTGDSVWLRDFKGKLVYLNFWRTDCGLCHVELPHLQRLISKMASHGIVFLNVAVGDDAAKWRQLVQEKELQGEHMLAKDAAEVARCYGLKDVPAYMLLDEEGRFLSLKAPRPSDPEAAKAIQQHLQVRQASLK